MRGTFYAVATCPTCEGPSRGLYDDYLWAGSYENALEAARQIAQDSMCAGLLACISVQERDSRTQAVVRDWVYTGY